MFQENGSQGISTTVIKEITVEYFHSIPVSVLPVTGNPEVISHFAEYDFLLPQYYLSPAFRPPSI